VTVRVEWRIDDGNGEAHGNSAKVAGDFGLSDLQDACQTYAGQPGLEVRDLPAGLSGAG